MSSAHRHPGLNTIEVASLADAQLDHLLAPYRSQKDAWLRACREGGTGLADGLFMAEGQLVVRALIDSDHRVVSVLCTPTRLEAMAGALAALPPETPVLVAERAALEGVVGFDLHRGILALGERSAPPSAADLLARCRLLVVCEDLANHDNTGAIFRNAACLAGGGSGVLLSPGCCDPLYRKSLRVSMGHALALPFARLEPWPDGLDSLARTGFTTIALTPDRGAPDIREYQHNPNERLAVLVGAEGPGLTADAMARAGRPVRIPMAPGADSLNVATALAVALSHLAIGRTPEPRPGPERP